MRIEHSRLGEVLLPDFLVVGAAKAATTSLHSYLDQHPEIRMPAVKENWFFSFVNDPPQYDSPGKLHNLVSSLDDYVKLFEDADSGACLGDASPSYLYTFEDTIRNIQSIYPQESLASLRFIISLREPVGRAVSQYWTFKRADREPLPFEAAADAAVIAERLRHNWNIFYDYQGFGLYYQQVKAYLDAFGSERVLVLLYDDIQRDAIGTCQSIFRFLGVNPDFVPDIGQRHNSVSGEPRLKWLVRLLTSRHPFKRSLSRSAKSALALVLSKQREAQMMKGLGNLLVKKGEVSPSVRQELRRDYAADLEKLERLIGRDLSGWKQPL